MHLTAIARAISCRSGLNPKLWRVMKLTAIILLSACLSVAARTDAQVNLHERNATLESVLTKIKQQTGYVFFYSYEDLQLAKKVTVDVKNVSVAEALKQCLIGQGLTFTIENRTVFISKEKPTIPKEVVTVPEINNEPPPIDVSGRVTDTTGLPLEGASVRVRGTNRGTTTDANGYFILKEVDENAVIEISYQGYETFTSKAGNSSLFSQVQLKIKPNVLDAVTINTGYQILKPNEVTGSVVVIDNKTLNQQAGTNILKRLESVTPGFFVNINKNPSSLGVASKTNILIRGMGTINGPTDPLIVLDDFPYEGDINNINPNDVESITVLKDGAATSIYGAKGGNGVIVITTKAGKFNQKVKVDFNSSLIVTDEPDLYTLPQLSSSDYIGVEEFLFNRGFFDNQINSIVGPLTPAVEVFLKRRNGLISSSDSASQINQLKTIDSRQQYLNHFYDKAVTQQYALSVRGGSNNIAWLASGAFDKNVSDLNVRSEKLNFRFMNTYKVTDKLLLSLNTYYTNSKQTGGGAPTYNSVTIASRYVPYLRFADENGNPVVIDAFLRGGYADTVGGGQLLSWKYAPLEDYAKYENEIKREELVATVGLHYKIIKPLSLDLKYQHQTQKTNIEIFSPEDSYNARSIINQFTNLNATVPELRNPVPFGGISYFNSSKLSSQALRGQFNFAQDWNNHMISAIAGFEIREIKGGGDKEFTLYGLRKDPYSHASVDYFNPYPTLPWGNSMTIQGRPTVGGFEKHRYVSVYGNVAYVYKGKYTISASGRRDASNTFGLSTNDKWKPLWSTGIAWDLSKEPFYKLTNVPLLKLKATLGYSGNVDPIKTALPILTYSPNSPITNFVFARITTLNDPRLRWEQIGQFNIGFDFSLTKQILSGSVEYFIKKSTDLYGETNYDYTTWGLSSQVLRNIADLKGNGFDIQLQSRNIDKTFKWYSTFIFNYNVNKVTKYNTVEAQSGIFLVNSDGQTVIPVIGKPLYSIIAYKWGGLDASGNPQGYVNGQLSTDYSAIIDQAQTKTVSSDNLKYFGSTNPTYFGSLINTFSWKGFAASVNISYKLGYYFRKSGIEYDNLFNWGIGHSEFERRWQKPGDELITNVPSMVYTNYPQFSGRNTFYRNSEIHVLKGDHIRLNYINLTYLLADKKNKFPFEQVRFQFNIANLGIIWRANKDKVDPDYPDMLRPPKQISVGLSATF